MDRPKGIPTVYNGIQFRSRLEARWAAFFDLIGWRYEYEPFELPGWIPDFLLLGDRHPMLVEVKPVVEFPEEIAIKIERSLFASGRTENVLIAPASIFSAPLSEDHSTVSAFMGWVGEHPDWYRYPDGPDRDPREYRFSRAFAWGLPDKVDFASFAFNWWGHLHDYSFRRGAIGWSTGAAEVVIDAWKRAGNLTQWKGKQSVTS